MDACPECGSPLHVHEVAPTLGERVADRVANVGSSWGFVGLMATLMATWVLSHTLGAATFDPYPFILMNLWISVLTSFQGPIIMMSQNRIAVSDRARAVEDHKVNARAEASIASLHRKIDALAAELAKASSRT